MWNPFSIRRSQAAVEMPLEQPAEAYEERPAHAKIAEIERIGPTAVATLTVTELTQERGVEMLADLLEELLNSGANHFVLDIQNVQFMDSACVGCLVDALNRMAKAGRGRIALANPAKSVQYLFRMTQLDRVFPICADVMAALTAVERVPDR